MGLDWKPRHRDLVIGNIDCLARITDKVRAKLAGILGEYIYPWPQDNKFLEEQRLTAEEFVQIVVDNPSDEEMIVAIKKLENSNLWRWQVVFWIKYNKFEHV